VSFSGSFPVSGRGGIFTGFLFEGAMVITPSQALIEVEPEEAGHRAHALVLAGMDEFVADDGPVERRAFLEVDTVSESKSRDIAGWETPVIEILPQEHRSGKGNDLGVSQSDSVHVSDPGVPGPLLNVPGEGRSL